MTLAAFAVGCDEVVGEPSLVEDLRVLATTTAPCAPLADNGAQLAVAVADPDQLGASVAAWICPPEEADCWFTRMDPVDGVARTPFVAPSSADLWVAACDPAVCDLDRLGQDQAALRDPPSWLATLPLTGVSAATRPLTVRPDEGTSTAAPPACSNPALRAQPNRESIAVAAAGAEVPLRFEVTGAGLAYAWTTAGRFTAPEYPIAEDGSVVATWEAPEAPGPVQLFVVFVETAPSAFGAVLPTEGSAVWAAVTTVQ